jgi:electron transport complex protein RnfG
VKKDGGAFDQLTGATITPRAIVKAVRKTLLYYREHRDALYAAGAEATAQASP